MSGKSRLGPDPSVGIADLQKQVWEVTERQGCKGRFCIASSKSLGNQLPWQIGWGAMQCVTSTAACSQFAQMV